MKTCKPKDTRPTSFSGEQVQHVLHFEYPPAMQSARGRNNNCRTNLDIEVLLRSCSKALRAGRMSNKEFRKQKFFKGVRPYSSLRYSAVPCSAVLQLKIKDFQSLWQSVPLKKRIPALFVFYDKKCQRSDKNCQEPLECGLEIGMAPWPPEKCRRLTICK